MKGVWIKDRDIKEKNTFYFFSDGEGPIAIKHDEGGRD